MVIKIGHFGKRNDLNVTLECLKDSIINGDKASYNIENIDIQCLYISN